MVEHAVTGLQHALMPYPTLRLLDPGVEREAPAVAHDRAVLLLDAVQYADESSSAPDRDRPAHRDSGGRIRLPGAHAPLRGPSRRAGRGPSTHRHRCMADRPRSWPTRAP